jgi:hypothetical protein
MDQPCTRCTALLPAAARFCPRCGAEAVARVVAEPVDEVLYQGPGLTVTTARVVIGDVAIAAPAVASVDVEDRENYPVSDVLSNLVGGLVVLAVGLFAVGKSGCVGLVILVPDVWIVLRGIVRGLAHRKWFALVVTTVAGERHELAADRHQDLQAAAEAVARAMGKR